MKCLGAGMEEWLAVSLGKEPDGRGSATKLHAERTHQRVRVRVRVQVTDNRIAVQDDAKTVPNTSNSWCGVPLLVYS
jgi:hypothetical protein